MKKYQSEREQVSLVILVVGATIKMNVGWCSMKYRVVPMSEIVANNFNLSAQHYLKEDKNVKKGRKKEESQSKGTFDEILHRQGAREPRKSRG